MTNEVLQKTASDEQNVSSSNGLEPSLRFTGFYENWHEKYIKDVADVIGGGTPDTTKLEYWNGNIQWFTPTEIGHNKYVNKSKRTITEKGLKNSSAKLLPPKTILLTSRATIGECSIIEKECATNQGFQSLVPNSLINNEFCYYLINTKKKELLRKASGSTFLEISNSEIKQIKCKFPSLLEQQKIATFLSLMDTRIEKQRQLVESLKKYKRGALSRVFNDVLETVKLSDISNFISSARTLSTTLNGNKGIYPVYDAAGIAGYIDYYDIDSDYITIVKDGSGVGRLQKCDKKSSFIGTLGALVAKNCTTDFLYAVLQTIDFSKFVTGMAIPHIYYRDYKSTLLPFPSEEKQHFISQLLKKFDIYIENETQKLTNMLAYKQDCSSRCLYKHFLEKTFFHK